MRSVDFELLSAIGGMCFLSSCCWRALSVLSSRHLRWKSHQPSQKPGVSVLLWHIHPTSASKDIWETTLENSSMVFSLLPASHCVSTLHDIAMQKPTCACTAYVGLHLIRKKMDQVAQKPGKGQLSPAGSSVLLPLLASWYVPSAFVMLTSCSSQNIGNTFPVSSDPPVSVARCKILSFSRNFVR